MNILSKMQAIIMAGGMGVRLRPLTFSIPKPLIPVGEKPILEMIISRLKKHGIKDIILAVGYKSDLIKAYFEDGKKFGVNITYFLEEKKLGTAGPLKIISGKEDISDPVLVMNGDIVTELDFDKLINFHKSKKSDFTVATKKHEYKSPFGVIKTESDKVISLEEKPVIKYEIYNENNEPIKVDPFTVWEKIKFFFKGRKF